MKHIPRKRFGQNFLTDQLVLQRIVDAIDPRRDDALIEIGPGLGALTTHLLGRLAHLDVVELDRDLVAHLQQRFDAARLTIHAGDALAFDFSSITRLAGKPLRIVGNLPYNISSPLLFHLAAYAPQVADQHFMLQKEVVERMVAAPGSKTFGRLSVMLQWRYQMEMLFVVAPDAFEPPPKVESAIVRMIPLAQPLACDAERLQQVVTKAFSQRRKVMRNCMAGLASEAQLIDAGIDPQARAETLGVAQFVGLANLMSQINDS